MRSGRQKSAFLAFLLSGAALALSLFLTSRYWRGVQDPSLFPSSILVLTLVNVNIILALLLVFLLSRNLIRLYFERQRPSGGAGFRTKLIVAFIGFSLIPSILLFLVASGLLTSSIENWFSIQVDTSLKKSLEVAQAYYQKAKEEVLQAGRKVASAVADGALLEGGNESLLREVVGQKQTDYSLGSLSVFVPPFTERVHLVNPSIPEHADLPATRDLVEKGLRGEEVTVVRTTEVGDLVRGIVPIHLGEGKVGGVVIVDTYVPQALVSAAEEISESVEDYRQLKAFKNPIKEGYIISFLVITLVILFSATWFGFYLARGITVPLQKLAEGTQAIAAGDLNVKIAVHASDEIGLLVDSFNKMTEDLKKATLSLRESHSEMDRRRAYMERVLENIATGVISIDARGMVTTFNRSAEQILQISGEEVRGKGFLEVLKQTGLGVLISYIERMKVEGMEVLEEEVYLESGGQLLTLRVHLSTLWEESSHYAGTVIVFDNLTDLLRAQRIAAWEEVARRIAHEIKNPLTPIQLCAERLMKKHAERSSDFDTVFSESTGMIIREVGSLKKLVDEFSTFARMPIPKPVPHNIHDILNEVILLYQGAHKDLVVLSSFSEGLPLVQVDRDQIKRAFVNLFDNAVEAVKGKGRLFVTTSHDPAMKRVTISLADEGPGIPPENLDKIFLPYFSQKRSGTGLGLAIVHRIVSDHGGEISIRNRHPCGTLVSVELPCHLTS